MSAGSPWERRAAFGFVWLGLFAILYTAGEALGVWPQMSSGAYRDLDLAVGALGVAALGLWLVRTRSSP